MPRNESFGAFALQEVQPEYPGRQTSYGSTLRKVCRFISMERIEMKVVDFHFRMRSGDYLMKSLLFKGVVLCRQKQKN